jgi:prolyl-tRNA editing enzyme YbaK/EbsC (Cys-tRNA(Pro) deacylase)
VREKVIKTAADLGLQVDVRRLDRPTRTVHEAASAVGCQDAQIAKSIVFVADGDPVIVIASGEHRIDTDKLAELLDVAEVRQASADEVRAATGFPVGGVPPFAHDLPVVFDEALLSHDHIYAAGGDGNSLFEVDPKNLASCTNATVAAIGA